MDMNRFRLMLLQGASDLHAACCYHKKDSKAPDYTPMANASQQSAEMGLQLGREQMAQAQQQYDENMAVAKPVVDEQLALMKQAKDQGDDYYNYMVSKQRPVEDALNAESMNNPTAAQDAADRALITGGDTAIYQARQGDIEDTAGRALADARAGQSATTNQMIRQGLRYGWSPEKIAAMTGQIGLGQASQQAAAVNTARTAGIDKARGLLTQDYNLRKSQEATNWGKKMDVAGLYRGLVGASQGSYGLAGNMGSAAVGNQMAPGNAMMNQNQGAAGTIMQGQGQRIQGLGSVLNAQTAAYNASNASSGAGLGSAIGAVGSIAATVL